MDTILFDVGGVLIQDVPVSHVVQRRLDLPQDTFRPLWTELMEQYGSGLLPEAAVWSAFEAAGAQPIDGEHDLLGEALEDSLHIHSAVQRFAWQLRDHGYQTGILSNTIPNHAKVLRRHGVYDGFDPDNVFLSNEIGFRKPDERAYQYALKVMDRRPGEVLLIDDAHSYLRTAAKLGMLTVHAQGDEAAIIAAISRCL